MAEDLEGRTLLSVGLDPTYGFGGLAPTILPQNTTTTDHTESLSQVALQNGQVVEVGTASTTTTGATPSTTTNLIVSRLNTNGFLDTSFGSNGTATIPTSIGGVTYTVFSFGVSARDDIVVQSNGNIDILATVTPTGTGTTGNTDFMIVQLTPNGGLDTSFGNSGARFISFGTTASPQDGTATALAIAPNGQLVALGSMTTGTADQVFAVVRLTTTGGLDTSFGTGGIAPVNFNVGGVTGETDSPSALVVQPNGAIVAVGSAQTPPNSSGVSLSVAAVARLTSAGVLDTSFNPTGRVPGTLVYSYNLGGTSNDEANDVTLEGSSIVIAGDTDQTFPGTPPTPAPPLPFDLTVTRLTTTGAFDNTFNGNGKFMLSLNQAGATFDSGGEHVTVLPSGTVLVGGFASPFNSNTNASGGLLLQLTPTGALDTSYGTNGVALLSVADVDSRLLVQNDGKVVFLAGSEAARTTAPAPVAATTTIVTVGSGKNAKASGVAITFNTGVNQAILTNPNLYQIRALKGRKVIKLKKKGGVVYNAATQTLTLNFAGRTAIGKGFQLVVTSGGIVGADGQVLPSTPIIVLPPTTSARVAAVSGHSGRAH